MNMDNAPRTAKRRTFYTAGYHQSRDELPAQAVNIACRPSERWRQEGTGRSLGCLYPNRAVWAASKSGGDWKAAYMRQLAEALDDGTLQRAVATIEHGDVLMCWEYDPRQCHRLVAAEFIAQSFPDQLVYGGEYWDVQAARKREGGGHPGQMKMLFMA